MNRWFLHPSASSPRLHRKSGQALLESFGMIMLLCLILFGMVQYVLMLTATEIIQYTADQSVRSRAVGFNRFMVHKVSRVASIPNAGRMTHPRTHSYGGGWDSDTVEEVWKWRDDIRPREELGEIWTHPSSSQFWQTERFNIPLFLGSETVGSMYGYLNYEDWDTIFLYQYGDPDNETVGVTILQEYPLRMPLLRAFSNENEIRIRKTARLADHADLYLE